MVKVLRMKLTTLYHTSTLCRFSIDLPLEDVLCVVEATKQYHSTLRYLHSDWSI